MDREQTMDVVDTPAHGSRDWPSIEDFQKPEKVQPRIYKVLEVHEHGQCRSYGPSFVLKLESKNGTNFFVWVTPSMFYAMKKRKTTNFILNLGSKISGETGKLFHEFKLYQKNKKR